MTDLRRCWIALLFLITVLPVGCLSVSDVQTHDVSMTDPQVNTGVLTEDATDHGLMKMQATLDEWNNRSINNKITSARETQPKQETKKTQPATPPDKKQQNPAQPATQETQKKSPPETKPNSSPAPQSKPQSKPKPQSDKSNPPAKKTPPVNYPANAGQIIPLTKMSVSEIHELIESIVLQLQTVNGYVIAAPDEDTISPPVPEEIALAQELTRTENDGSRKFLRLGFRTYTSQLPQLWIYGLSLANNKSLAVNPDVKLVKPAVDAAVKQITELRKALTSSDLEREIIKLSYIDAVNATNILKSVGINAISDITKVPTTLNYNQLPLVVPMPDPTKEDMAVVGGKSSGGGKFGLSVIATQATPLNNNVNASPASQLLVVYHPAHPEQLSKVRALLKKYVDRPARQIFIEGMVLEISEDGLDDLGIKWNFQSGSFNFMLGSLNAGSIFDTGAFGFTDNANLPKTWDVQIRALIREGKAEILSRPAVLTLNNRQAAIRVGEDIPIATSQEGTNNNSNKVSFNFNYLPVGIMLNVRPRISEKADEVSMLIDTTVSSVEPGQDLQILSNSGEVLASAPSVASRRVQTYSRIRDRTPLIIGGLVSRDRITTKDKVPLLGDFPLIGAAFRSEKTTTKKREVIIVITPYILPEEEIVTPSIPKDDDVFDRTGNQLFRDAYRIRSQDVFDLSFLFENARLVMYQRLADKVLNDNYKMAAVPPFNEFVNGRIPGEDTLVHRMIYEVIKRTKVDNRVNPSRVIYLDAKDVEGYHVQFLEREIAKFGNGKDMKSFFRNTHGKAIAFTYYYDRASMDENRLATEPIPDIKLVDCPDRDAWQKQLWDLNHPTAEGRQRYTILIQNEDDIVRLQRAMMLKKIITLNGGPNALTMNNFTIGRILAMPQLERDQVTVMDADVARYFYHTELYYAAAIETIEKTLDQLDTAFRLPDVQPYLHGETLPTPMKHDGFAVPPQPSK